MYKGVAWAVIISDATIKKLLDTNVLEVVPVKPEQIQPASGDIRLGSSFSIMETDSSGIVTMDKPISYKMIESSTYLLLPGQFVLATTKEYIKLPDNITAFVEGRSSLGRMGLFIQNAGWVDPGFEGEITLELFNASQSAIELETGRRIGQLVFVWMDRSAENPYKGKYNGQTGATGSRIYLDEDIVQG